MIKLNMFLKKTDLKKSGFSLLEIMVSTALLTIVVTGVITLFVQSKTKNVAMLGDLNIKNLANEIKIALSNRSTCTKTLSTVGNLSNLSLSSTPITVNKILDNGGGAIYETGSLYGFNDLQITGMVIDLWSGKTAAPDSVGAFRLKLTIKKLTKNSVGLDSKDIYVLLGAKVNAADRVIDCYSFLDDEYLLRTGVKSMTGPLVITFAGNGLDITNGWAQAMYFLEYSDSQLKHNVEKIPNVENTVRNIQGVQFNWNTNNEKDWGVIAQDLEKVAPHLVNTNNKTDKKTVSYNSVIPLLIEEYKILLEKNNYTRKKIEKAKIDLNELSIQ